MRYFHAEHVDAYRRIAREGLRQWDDLHEPDAASVGPDGHERFPNRAFLERVLDELAFADPAAITVWEYGCGTGPAARFLAARGFEVEATDLVPEAIELARRFAAEAGVEVRFAVGDVCALAAEPPTRRYDLVVDSFCLQSVVTDQDRADLYAAVRARLAPGGRYLISTAMYEHARDYGDDHHDARTGCCYRALAPEERPDADSVLVDGRWFRPHRRHLRPDALRAELTRAGFDVRSQRGPHGGELVCVAA